MCILVSIGIRFGRFENSPSFKGLFSPEDLVYWVADILHLKIGTVYSDLQIGQKKQEKQTNTHHVWSFLLLPGLIDVLSIRIYISAFIHIYMHLYIRTLIVSIICIYLHVSLYPYVFIHHVRAHMYIYVHWCIHALMYICIYTSVSVHIYLCPYLFTHKYNYLLMYTCIRFQIGGRFLWANDNAQLAVGHIGDLIGDKYVYIPACLYIINISTVCICMCMHACILWWHDCRHVCDVYL